MSKLMLPDRSKKYVVMTNRIQTKILLAVCLTAFVLLTSNKKEAQSQVYAEQISRMDGMVQVDGNQLHVDSLRGKMLIISFWASYDAQSRINSYQLLKLKNEFEDTQFHNGDGLEVLSISLDKYSSPLKKAIATDGTSVFHHICDFKGVDSELASLFDVYRPVNLLVDADGTVVARDFNVSTLRSTLELLSSEE